MSNPNTIVLKFGGSVLASEASLPLAVHEIYRWRREGWRVVAVVSALAGRTDELLARASTLFARATGHATAALAACGELESAALLGVLLDRAGMPASVITPAAAQLRAEGDPLDSSPTSVDSALLSRALDAHGVIVVPGFVALDSLGRTVLLGRGGSDLTALFLAAELSARRCRLVKDVPALFERDPSLPGPPPRRYETASWAHALNTDGTIVQHKATRFAQSRNLRFELASLNSDLPSVIGGAHSSFRELPSQDPSVSEGLKRQVSPLRVALLGLGTVGRGVLEHIARLPDHFTLVGVCARDKSKHQDIPDQLFSSDAIALASRDADVVVEALGGLEPARQAAIAALSRGAHFITANKSLLAAHATALRALAQKTGGSVRCSASVGGCVPILEYARAAAKSSPIVAIEAVLNGTSNFVLESCSAGQSLASAVARAQALGFA